MKLSCFYYFSFLILSVFMSCSKGEDVVSCDPNLAVDAERIINSECGAANGTITALGTGGKGNLTFSLNGTDYQPSKAFQNLAAGNYMLTVKDENNCTATKTITISEAAGINVNFVLTEAGCGSSQGKISATATGGVQPYQFSINNGAFQSSALFENLPRGEYAVTIKDANNCSTQANTKVLSGIKYSASVSNILSAKCAIAACHGGSQSPNLSVFNNIKTNASRIKIRTGNKTMPPHGATALTDEEIAHIACWVDDGAIQN